MAVGASESVGAALGAERLGDLGQARAEAGQHVGEHVVAADEQAARLDLAGGVPVADVPGEAGEVAGDRHERLGCGGDADAGAVGAFEHVALVERGRRLEVDHYRRALGGDQPLAAQEALVIGQIQRQRGGAALAVQDAGGRQFEGQGHRGVLAEADRAAGARRRRCGARSPGTGVTAPAGRCIRRARGRSNRGVIGSLMPGRGTRAAESARGAAPSAPVRHR
jgi:hypothetical protein